MTSTSTGDTPRPNFVASGFGLAVLGIFIALYVLRRELYFQVLDLWSSEAFRYPFLDLLYVPDLVKCWNQGINVYTVNPCDPLGRLFDYSPLWLRLSWLADAVPFINPMGLALDALFMVSLTALPRPRRGSDYLPLLLAIVSPMAVFALERGNVDLLMFVFAMLAVVCMDRGFSVRMLGYGTILLASLLKFYPFVLFILLLRERLRISLITAAIAVCAMGGFVWFYFGEVMQMGHNVPHPFFFENAFGMAELPSGLGIITDYVFTGAGFPQPAAGNATIRVLVSMPATLLLILVTRWAVLNLLRRDGFGTALDTLHQREKLTLVAGAVLTCGCFIAGRSVGYREVVMVLAIPALTALARTAQTGQMRRVFVCTVWTSLFLLWYPVPQRLVNDMAGDLATGAVSPVGVAFWLAGEICWWCLIAVLLAVLIRFGTTSAVWRDMEGHPWMVRKMRLTTAGVSAGSGKAMRPRP